DVEDEIRFIQKNNGITREALIEVLRAQGFSFEDYKNLMRVSVAKRRLIDRELRPLSAVTDEQVKNHYYTDPQTLERRKAQRLVLTFDLDQLILPSKAMAELAHKRLSDGMEPDALMAELAPRGAERVPVGKISEENMNPSVRNTVSGLRAGEFSRPVESGAGYLILRVNAVGAPEDPEFNRVKEQVRNQLYQKALRRHLDTWLGKERAASFVHITKGA
ncbi:MAG: peptidyl-prolyl cis-trans isomerase, partial [Bdellovibrionales bacterium]|nr:peptidyl-prolyl cis-trans isomerase [Bdellovibrionales bacterium]